MASTTQVKALPLTRGRASDFLSLTKPRVNLLVVSTTLAGYYMAGGADGSLIALVSCVIGTAMVSGGAAALNQVYERETDALMRRTRLRPLPDGRLHAAEAALFACFLILAGLTQLAVGANLVAAGVALVTAGLYAGVYTPLKRRTSFATVVGAVPGALPPIIGWAAARGTLDPASWSLFAIVFLWQLPHFLAIAWLYRDDYARAAFPLLPVIEPDGRSTARQAVLYAAALVPASLAPTPLGLAGIGYFAGAGLLSLVFLALTVRFGVTRTAATARQLFIASVFYLPIVWILMIADRV